MKIEFDKSVLDLGFTPVENMFIHTYLGLANGDQIKVYLYALSRAYSPGGEDVTNENIAFEMGLTEGQVIDAWSFWANLGLVEIQDDRYIFKSLRNSYINQMMDIDQDADSKKEGKQGYKEERKIIDEAFSKDTYVNDAFNNLIKSIEEFISLGMDIELKLTPREIEMIHNQIQELNLSYDYFAYAFPLASAEVDSKNVAQLLGVVRNWVIDGATDEEKLTALLEKKQAQRAAISAKKPRAKSGADTDDRLNKEERKRFIEEKMKKRNF